MAKRPTSRSQAADTAAATPAPPKPRRARVPRTSDPTPAGAPGPSDTRAARAEATEERPINLDPGPRPESLDAPTSSRSMASEPSEHDIRMRAYHRYLERGGEHGLEFNDWVEAERDLKTQR
jgi:hypothetical protein